MIYFHPLVYPSNAMYMDPDDKNVYDDEGIFMTTSYACGAAMTVSCLDSLVCAVRRRSFDACARA